MKSTTNKKIYILIFAYTVFLSFLCVGSSPLLNYMDPDSQNFRLMGRAVAAGEIAFRDIFDHKGLYIFFIDAIGALISPGSSLGIFILETIGYFINTVIVYKIAHIITGKEVPSFLSAAAFLGYSFNYFTFITGNLTEDWCLILQMISIWFIAKYYLTEERNRIERSFMSQGDSIEHPPVYMFVHGLTACLAGFMRPNNAGIWIPFAVVLAIRLFVNKKIKNFFINLLALALGVLAGALPLIIYGIKNDLFEEIIYGTFGANMTYTSNNSGFDKAAEFIKNFVTNPAVLIFITGVVGCVIVCKYYFKANRYFAISFVSMFALGVWFMNVSMRNNGQYQHLYILFSIPVFIGFFNVLESNKIREKAAVYITAFMILITGAALVANLGLVKQVMKFGSYHYIYEAAVDMDKIIEDKNAKVISTGCNSVLYNETHTLSHLKYFITYGGGLDYSVFPDATIQQMESILSLENDYVMIHFEGRDCPYNIPEVDGKIMKCLEDNYELVYIKDDAEIIGLYKRK